MKQTLIIACIVLVLVGVLLGANHFKIISVSMSDVSSGKSNTGVPFDVHYGPETAAGVIDASGKALIGRTLNRHHALLRRADVYVSVHVADDAFGLRDASRDTSVRVSLKAIGGVQLHSRMDIARREDAAMVASAAIDRCVAALEFSRSHRDFKKRNIVDLRNL